jgi:hypothetical protein
MFHLRKRTPPVFETTFVLHLLKNARNRSFLSILVRKITRKGTIKCYVTLDYELYQYITLTTGVN